MASLWTFWAWILAHAVTVLAGISAVSALCSAILALWAYNLHRQQKKAAQYHKASMEALSSRVQALDDRIAIVALSAAQTSPGCQPIENNSEPPIVAVAAEDEGPAGEAFRAIRDEIERLTTEFIETSDPERQDLSRTPPADENDNEGTAGALSS